jgi:hypothetical protein
MKRYVLAAAFSGILAGSTVLGQENQQQSNPAQIRPIQARSAASSSSSAPAPPPRSHSPLISSRRNKHEDIFYRSVWGVDNLDVREVSAGALLRFTYQVVDANKARSLNDVKIAAYLIDESTGAVLQVPSLPKVGLLRQKNEAENGKQYWIAFSNKGVVKRGSRVDVMIGYFRAIGLTVR